MIHGSPSIQACVTTNLVDHFQNMTPSRHYALSPSLRHVVSETAEEIKSKQGGRPPVFVVIEEHNELAPVDMINGECSIMDEMFLRDGEKTPALIGGRDGEQFVTAWPTPDGAWPELPNNHPSVNLILAGCPGRPADIRSDKQVRGSELFHHGRRSLRDDDATCPRHREGEHGRGDGR